MRKIKELLVSINKSIFFQTTLILSALCILIVFYLIAFAFRPIIKAEQEKNHLLYENALTSAETIIDYSLLNIHDIITKTSQENCIMSAIVSPDSPNDSEILLSLSSLKGTSELIKEAFLFIPASDNVYTSKYKLIKRTNFYEKNVIDLYYSSSENLDYISQSGRISRFFIVDSKIFMIRDFPLEGENRLGTFFIKIDVNKFLKILKINETIYPNHLYIYNSMGIPLFINDSSEKSSADNYFTTIKDKSAQTISLNNKLLLHTRSDLTHFSYLLVVDDSSENNTFMLVLLICPVILICLGMAFFVSTKILIPIKNLIFIADAMRLTEISLPGQKDSHDKTADFSNNMKYLNSSFVNAVSSINYLNNLLEKLKPDISDIIFKDLLTGKPIAQDDITNYLANINSPISIEGLYNVMVIKANKDDTLYLTKNYLSAIENILNIKTKDFCSYHIQVIDDYIYAIIFQFHNSSAHTIKVFERDLMNMLTNTSSYLQVPVLIGTGKIYKSLQDLHFSYSDALNMTMVKPSSSNGEDSADIETYYSKSYHSEHIEKLFQFIEHDDEDSALLFASQFILKIYNENNSLDDVRLNYIAYAEAVLNKLLEFKNINLDANALFQINAILEKAEEKTTMKNTIESFIKEAVLLAFDHYKKFKHPYIIKASEYIKTNYSDSSLSLSEISERLGTNSTYLSKLFKENLGVNFNDFINSYRIDAAKFLLNNTDKKIEQISNETGFNSQQNFIRVFKKIEGVAPGQYRKSRQVDIYSEQ